MTKLEIAQKMAQIADFCSKKWEPEFRMVKYCIEKNSDGLNYYVDIITSVTKVLGVQ